MKTVNAACTGMLLLSGFSSSLTAQDETQAPKRPAHQLLRFNEDWSVLRGFDLSQIEDCWDGIKFVPLSDDGDAWASFGGQMQARFEDWNNFAFGTPPNDDDSFLLWRLLMHGDIHFSENLRIYVEGKSALSTDRDLPGGRRTLDVDTLDLEQAFVDFRIPFGDASSLTLRPGRQQFLFGKQRLVSPLPWANTMRRWDGVSAILEIDSWSVHGFWSQFVPVQKYDFNTADAQTQFFGAYATTQVSPDFELDLYFLGLDRDDAITFNGTTGREDRYTIGARLFGSLGESRFDYDVESAYQFGEVGSGDISAFMVGSEIGYRLADAWSAPRISLGIDYGSGDESPGGDVETFNQLFPLGHAYLGYMDFVGRQNIFDVNAGVSFTPFNKTTVGAYGHFFWRADDADALYNAGGGVVRPGGAGSSLEVGQEIDLTVKYQFDRHLSALLGYSHFFPGDFINNSGASEDMDFVYFQLQNTF